MGKQNAFDLVMARAARDAGLAQVSGNAGVWFEEAIEQVEKLPRDWTGTGEDLRFLIEEKIGRPHSHYVWGALVNHAQRRKLLIKTGQRIQMRSLTSHARTTDVYEVIK